MNVVIDLVINIGNKSILKLLLATLQGGSEMWRKKKKFELFELE